MQGFLKNNDQSDQFSSYQRYVKGTLQDKQEEPIS